MTTENQGRAGFERWLRWEDTHWQQECGHEAKNGISQEVNLGKALRQEALVSCSNEEGRCVLPLELQVWWEPTEGSCQG